MKIDWKVLLNYAFKILTPFVPKGWRTIILNAVMFLLGVAELILQEGTGLISLLCQNYEIGCDPQVAGVVLTVSSILNMLLRAVTDTPVAKKEPVK
jgi:hypothetical protein